MFQQVKGLGPAKDVGFGNAFEVLAKKKLLKPSRAVQQKIDSVMNRIPKNVTLIGLQGRKTENNAVGKGIKDSFLSCAASVVKEEEAKAQGQGQGTAGRRRKYAYYLATDYHSTRAHFQRVLGDQLYVLENTFGSHKDTSSSSSSSSGLNSTGDMLGNESIDVDGDNDVVEFGDNDEEGDDSTSNKKISAEAVAAATCPYKETEAVVRNSIGGVQTAVAEMYLLAQSNRIISAPYLAFGYFVHGYDNIQPNIVKRDGECIKRKSTQPCFQYWFGFANGGAKCSIKATVEMDEDYGC